MSYLLLATARALKQERRRPVNPGRLRRRRRGGGPLGLYLHPDCSNSPHISAPATTLDGRLARAARSRRAVVDALLDLLEDGDLRPTAARIAERAGVALRSVFQHFADLEALFGAAAERQMERLAGLLGDLPADGPLAERLEAFVQQRARLLEAIAPVRRAALLREPFSPAIATRLQLMRQLKRAEVERTFAAELERRERAERQDLLDALAAVSSWPTWESLRRHQRLSVERARRVMARTLAALLGAEGIAGRLRRL